MELSFIIITNGNKPDKLYRQIETICQQNIPSYEIIVCGNLDKLQLDKEILSKYPNLPLNLVPDNKNADKGSLGALRNSACEKAAYDNLVISDDDMLFTTTWYQNLIENGSEFEILTTCIKNPDGTRFWDNACYLSPTKGHINLNYDEEDDYLYMSGGQSWLIKKKAWEKIKWDEKILIYSMKSLQDYSKGLHNEDTDFALRCREANFKITHNQNILVYHNDLSYTAAGRVIRKRSFMPNYKWITEITLPEIFLINFATQMLQSNIIEGLDILRKLADEGSMNAVHLINNYENSLGGRLDNSKFSFVNPEYENLANS
jgi:glycosyltransferase involved in cell wall biosynthesis